MIKLFYNICYPSNPLARLGDSVKAGSCGSLYRKTTPGTSRKGKIRPAPVSAPSDFVDIGIRNDLCGKCNEPTQSGEYSGNAGLGACRRCGDTSRTDKYVGFLKRKKQ